MISVREIIRARDRRSLFAYRCESFWIFVYAARLVTPCLPRAVAMLSARW